MRNLLLILGLLLSISTLAQSKKELAAQVQALQDENKVLQSKINQLTNPQVKLDDKHQKASYALGVLIGNNVAQQNLDSLSLQSLYAGLVEIVNKKTPAISLEECGATVQAYIAEVTTRKSEALKAAGTAFLEANKTKPGIIVTASGLQYRVNKSGTGGTSPQETDKVTVHYTGSLMDGTKFQSSLDTGEPVTFTVNEVIPGWTEALKLMKPGDQWTLYIPSDLAFGDQGAGGVIPPGAVVVFEVELIKVN